MGSELDILESRRMQRSGREIVEGRGLRKEPERINLVESAARRCAARENIIYALFPLCPHVFMNYLLSIIAKRNGGPGEPDMISSTWRKRKRR